jgi:enamine deaminase RidA (YjgF/YER057c/UK114 family)
MTAHRARPVEHTAPVQPSARFVQATVVPSGCEMVLISGQTPDRSFTGAACYMAAYAAVMSAALVGEPMIPGLMRFIM